MDNATESIYQLNKEQQKSFFPTKFDTDGKSDSSDKNYILPLTIRIFYELLFWLFLLSFFLFWSDLPKHRALLNMLLSFI